MAAVSWSKQAGCLISSIMPLEATVRNSRNTTQRTSIQFVFLDFLWEAHSSNSSELMDDHETVS